MNWCSAAQVIDGPAARLLRSRSRLARETVRTSVRGVMKQQAPATRDLTAQRNAWVARTVYTSQEVGRATPVQAVTRT